MTAHRARRLKHPTIRRIQQELRQRTRLEVQRTNTRKFQEPNRLRRLPLYLFTILDELKAKARARGINVIDLGMGTPDLPAPKHVREEMQRRVGDPENHGSSRKDGEVERRVNLAIATWYKRKFGVALDPQ